MTGRHTYRYHATLRIWNAGAFHDQLAREAGLHPTSSHLKGTMRSATSRHDQVWEYDMWSLDSPLPGTEPWEAHVQWIWDQVRPHKALFQQMLSGPATGDISLRCTTDCEAPLLSVDAPALEILRVLPLGICFNYTPL